MLADILRATWQQEQEDRRRGDIPKGRKEHQGDGETKDKRKTIETKKGAKEAKRGTNGRRRRGEGDE